jgi:HAD superfamily hydrolase (TIGR01549 family)
LDFNSIWIPVISSLVDEIVEEFAIEFIVDIKRKLLNYVGVMEDKVEPFGILAWGTSEDIAKAFKNVLVNEGVEEERLDDLEVLVSGKINRLAKEKSHLIRPIGNIINLFKHIKEKNIYIGLATSDSYESTNICLEQLEIKKYFDFIGANDGVVKSKPNPELLHKFCDTCGLKPEEVAVVGDTKIDMMLASNGNAALAIGVLSGTNELKDLAKGADFIINSVEELIDRNGELLWC